MSLLGRNPYKGKKFGSFRKINGSDNNLEKPRLGANGTPFIRLGTFEYEDGVASPAGVANDAEGNPLIGVDGKEVSRQPIPIFSKGEKERLEKSGLEVVENKDGLSNNPDATFVLLNPLDRPSARIVSNSTSKLDEGETSPSSKGLTAINWACGQLINHDLNLARLSETSFNIDIPEEQFELLKEELVAFRLNTNNAKKIALESKRDTIKRLGRSPNLADAFKYAVIMQAAYYEGLYPFRISGGGFSYGVDF